MTQRHLIGMALALVAVFVLVAGRWIFGSSGANDAENGSQVVYVCEETEQIVVGPRQPVPAVNPATGRTTLWRAMYCGECERWYPVPPADSRPGNPLGRRCPQHRTPMSVDGPIE